MTRKQLTTRRNELTTKLTTLEGKAAYSVQTELDHVTTLLRLVTPVATKRTAPKRVNLSKLGF